MSYAVYIGSDLTADGVAYLAGYGDEPSSHWLEVVPRATHPAGAVVDVGVTAEADMPGVRSTIPQAPETFGHVRVSYSQYLGVPAPITNGGLNEHGVAVRDVWSTSHERLTAMTPTDQRGPNYSDLSRLVLERCRSAREGVELIGDLIAEHGESTYGGNSHLIADAEEAWVVVEFAGGVGLWAAERLGPQSIRVSRPGYLGQIPPDYLSHDDFAGAPHLIDFAVDRGWYDPAAGPLDVNAVYGDGKGRWDGVVWMESELAGRAAVPGGITLEDVFWAVRTERLTGDSAGYGQVVPLLPEGEPSALRHLWHSVVGPVAAPFTPVPLGATSVPPELAMHRYLTRGESAVFMSADDDEAPSSVAPAVEATRSAVAVHKRLLYLLNEHQETFLPEVLPVWPAFERQARDALEQTLTAARLLLREGRADVAAALLTRLARDEAIRALDLGETMVASMDARAQLLYGVRQDRGWRGAELLW